MLTVYIDFKCPASFLALRPIYDLMADTNVEVNWKPFRSRQPTIPEEKENETRGETHRRVRAMQRRATHQRYALARGVDMHFRDEPGKTDTALAALNLDLANPRRFVRTAFKFYWMSDYDLDDENRVTSILAASGNFLEQGQLRAARDELEDYQIHTEENGVFITPTFILGEHTFVGREHLPLIKQMLGETVAG